MKIFLILCSLFFSSLQAQDISNLNTIDGLLAVDTRNLIIVGEEHTSAANPVITLDLIKYLSENYQLTEFLIEFSPSEAYLYNRYLETGQEELLNGTIYGGTFDQWKAFWKDLFIFNNGLEEKIRVTGIDFERPQIFALALSHLVDSYRTIPDYLDSLDQIMSNEDFLQDHNNRFPDKEDKAFMNYLQTNLLSNLDDYRNILNKTDFTFLQRVALNQVEGFAGKRENQMNSNMINFFSHSTSTCFLLLIGQGHANYANKNLSSLIKNYQDINVVSGIIVYHGSQQWKYGFDKKKTIYGLDEKPWRKFKTKLLNYPNKDLQFSQTPKPLKRNADYIIIAQNQGVLTY